MEITMSLTCVVNGNHLVETLVEPCTRYCHIHLACTSVCYERKMHVLIIESKTVIVKNLVCFNFVEV